MASLKQLTFNILNQVRAGVLSDDERIAESQVVFMIHYVRALFLKQSLDKNQTIHSSLAQTVCLTMDLVDKSECPEIRTDCVILRSTTKLPQLLRLNYGNALLEVTGLDSSLTYPLISLSRARWSKYNKYTALNKKAFIKNDYLYITNDVYLEKIGVIGVFSNPVLANSLSCTPLDDEYPITDDMIDGITMYIVRNILSLMLIVNTDELNDSNGNVTNSARGINNLLRSDARNQDSQ